MKEFYEYIVFFLVFSFIGWVLECLYKSILQKKIVNSGFLYGPVCPIYGFGALFMYLSLINVSNDIIVLFIFGLVVLSIYEYLVGWFLEVTFKVKYWDYSTYKFNINGRVCLKNSMFWGILGVIFMKLLVPIYNSFIYDIPQNFLKYIAYALSTILIIDTALTVYHLIKINITLRDWDKIKTELSEKLKSVEAKNANIIHQMLAENREKVITAEKKIFTILAPNVDFDKTMKMLKENSEKVDKTRKEKINQIKENLENLIRKEELQRKLFLKKTRRLRNAFPTMTSARLDKLLNRKH